MTTLAQHINAWIAKRRAHHVKLAVDTLIMHHVRNDPELTHRIATTAPNCVFNDRPIGDMVVITQPADRSLSATIVKVAERLVDQDDEPEWLTGNYSARMNYWRDKCIIQARILETIAKDVT